jgi:hypothetical protein
MNRLILKTEMWLKTLKIVKIGQPFKLMSTESRFFGKKSQNWTGLYKLIDSEREVLFVVK